MNDAESRIIDKLNRLEIELPSWGFANTGTRFGKFIQPEAAVTPAEKLSDAAEVHRWTGSCPRVAVHVAWDFPDGVEGASEVASRAESLGIRIGSVNPTLFESQEYKFGSAANPDPRIRLQAWEHLQRSVDIMRATGSRELVLWFADGSNYPGTAHIRQRKAWFEEALSALGRELRGRERMLIEYKPFEPAFYHTDIADWGMAFLMARKAGDSARVLVDTGHHYQSQNIEQIVAWLLSEEMLGGFHFNDRKYGDDDLTVGSIDPYQLFRIFFEIFLYEWEQAGTAPIGYMVDQSHNLKGKLEAMLQTVSTVQEIVAKAAAVDFERLLDFQKRMELIDAEECLREAFNRDVRPVLEEWRKSKGLARRPLDAFRQSGYLERIREERSGREGASTSGYA